MPSILLFDSNTQGGGRNIERLKLELGAHN